MQPQPLIAVSNVEASSRWYQAVLGAHSGHGGPEYERLGANDVLIMQLHHFEVDHHHGPIGSSGEDRTLMGSRSAGLRRRKTTRRRPQR